MDREQEGRSPGVPETAKQGEEIEHQRADRWSFVEPAIWTERMIAALETGVKGGKWFSLMDKVYAERTLRAAWNRVKRNRGAAGVDRQSTDGFEAHADRYVRMRLRSILRKRTGKTGRGRGADHQRWPNAYLDAHGLFTMTAARRAAGYSR